MKKHYEKVHAVYIAPLPQFRFKGIEYNESGFYILWSKYRKNMYFVGFLNLNNEEKEGIMQGMKEQMEAIENGYAN